MEKTHLLISCDMDIKIKFQETIGKGNVSKTLNEFMENVVATSSGDKSKLNKRILNLELKQEVKVNTESQIKINKLKEQLDQLELLNAAEEKERLVKEQEAINKVVNCISCSNQIQHKDLDKYKFESGSCCKNCFMNATVDDIKRWNKKEV